MTLCRVPGCPVESKAARGLCSPHYRRGINGRPIGVPFRDWSPPVEPFSPWCRCSRPDQQPVTMFGTVTLVDVTECTRCHRPPRPPVTESL